MTATPTVVGIDVAHAALVVAVRPTQDAWTLPNDERGVADLVRRLHPLHPALVVLEATGGYERTVVGTLATAGFPVVVAHPRQVRDCARATGQLAKTDRVDAETLALCGECVHPEPRPLPDAATHAVDAVLTRRRQRRDMLTAERNRLGHAVGTVRRDLREHSRWLERRLADLDRDLDQMIQASPLWRAKDDLLHSAPGVGPVVSRTRLGALPEVGTLTHPHIAALAGVAPFARDSGTWRGQGQVRGGRAMVRTARYLAALVATRHTPIIAACYQRLVAAGTPKKVALTACVRKLLTILNAMVRSHTVWRTTTPQTA